MGRGANPQFLLSITAANGFTYQMWDGSPYNLKASPEALWAPPIATGLISGASPGTGQRPPSNSPPRGSLVGADVRLNPAGGWTFASFRLRVVEPPAPFDPFIWGTGSTFTSANILQSWTLFDSGTLGPGVIGVGSATDSFIREQFASNPQPFGSWLMLCYDWTTSAGAGTSTLLGTLHADLDHVQVSG